MRVHLKGLSIDILQHYYRVDQQRGRILALLFATSREFHKLPVDWSFLHCRNFLLV